MSVRAVDTFYLKGGKQLTVLANRGLNGIDGTVSTAIGASRCFGRTTLITGDLTMQHDLNALALQRELRACSGSSPTPQATRTARRNRAPSVMAAKQTPASWALPSCC